MAAALRDYIIIGAGPGGLQLGWFLEKMGRDYVILEATADVGSFFSTLPRSRKLISFNRVNGLYDDPEIRLRWDWNALLCDYELPFSDFSHELYPHADQLIDYLRAFWKRYQLNIRFETEVASVTRPEGTDFHVVTTAGEQLRCRALVVATGLSAPYIPDIPGIEAVTEGYENVSLAPDDFANQKVLVLGKGNSALEFVEEIIDTPALIHVASPSPIRFAWDTRHPGHVRANYARLLDTYQLKLLNGTLDCTIQRIRRDGSVFLVDVTYSHADGETETLVYDRVVRATGFCFDASVLSDLRSASLVHQGRLPAMSSTWESTDVPDLWFAGTLMQSRDFKRASSAFIDGFRYNVRTLGHVLQARYHGSPLPASEFPADPAVLASKVSARICRTSALWAQFGYLCDVVVLDELRGWAYHVEEVPVELTDEHAAALGRHWYRITYEWGEDDGDVFALQRHPNHQQAAASRFLHPVVRRFHGPNLVEEHHLLEDLFGMYRASGAVDTFRLKNGRDPATYHVQEHEAPLLDFFARHVGVRPKAPKRPLRPPQTVLASSSRSASKAAASSR